MTLLKNFKLLQTDTFKSGLLKGIKAMIVIAFLATIFIAVKVYFEKTSLDKRYEVYSDRGGEYNISLSSNFNDLMGKPIAIRELSENDYSLADYEKEVMKDGYKAMFSSLGNLSIYLFQFNKDNIFHEWKYATTIKYKKEKYYLGSETYYDPGKFSYDEYGFSNYTPGGLKERAVLKERQRESPEYCFTVCKEYYQKNELTNYNELKGDISFSKDILDKINGGNNYYYFTSVSRPNTNNSYKQKFKTDNFDIDIDTHTTLYERKFGWTSIREDVMFYFLLLFAFPFFYYTKFLIGKSR